MNCEAAAKHLALLLYGDLSFDEEEQVQMHLDDCASCRRESERQRAIHRLLDQRELEPSASLLNQCRRDLESSLTREDVRPDGGFWHKWESWFASLHWKPAGALALIALGFFGARLTNNGLGFGGFNPTSGPSALIGNGVNTAGLEPMTSRVRYVEPNASGQVQIVVDETRQRILSGRLDDEKIRHLLLSAAKDPSDPGLRVESVDILNGNSDSADVRGALVAVLLHDSNAGVRLKALEGLKSFAADPEVRKALSQALLKDTNPGVRTQAIDLLTQNKGKPAVGVLQELLAREDNSYVRQRCQRALREMNASEETY